MNGAAAISELRREGLAPAVADRPLTATVGAHQAVCVRIHEHEAGIELAESQLAREGISRQGPRCRQGP
jgi:hypothetical protein